MIKGVEAFANIGALDSLCASLVGVNVPLTSCPFAGTINVSEKCCGVGNFWSYLVCSWQAR